MAATFLALALVLSPAIEQKRMTAEDARQGVVSDGRHLFAIDNATIAKLDARSGAVLARWRGDPTLFRHMNSCIALRAQLVCAASNYPKTPMASSVEWFDTRSMKHVASRSLGPGRGSLTWLDWHDGSWWACFANYDGKGGDAGRDHRSTTIVQYDSRFVEQGAWLLPDSVLERMAPYSSSGGVWGRDGYLYVTGHDRPELYVLKLPEAGSELLHVGTMAIPTNGQAIAWDPKEDRLLWSIERSSRSIVASRIPAVDGQAKAQR